MSDQLSPTSPNPSSGRRGTVITYAKALHLALLEASEEGQEIVLANFAKEILQNGHADLLPKIEQEFEELVKKSGNSGDGQIENREYLDKLNQFAKESPDIWKTAQQRGGIAFRHDEAEK